MTEIHFNHFIDGNLFKVRLDKHIPQKTYSFSHPDEEGYSFESVTFYWDEYEKKVYQETCSGGRDCDGEIRTTSKRTCPVENLYERQMGSSSIFLPEWEMVDEEVYDQYAQLAGY